MQGRSRRILLMVAGAVAIWYLVVLFSWALRPLHDSIPVSVPGVATPTSQDVTCNTLFAGSAHDGPLPELRTLLPLKGPQITYNRPGCEAVQRDARIVFGLDTLGALAVIGGLLYIALRTSGEPAESQTARRASYA